MPSGDTVQEQHLQERRSSAQFALWVHVSARITGMSTTLSKKWKEAPSTVDRPEEDRKEEDLGAFFFLLFFLFLLLTREEALMSSKTGPAAPASGAPSG